MKTYKGFNKDMTAKMDTSMKKGKNTKRKKLSLASAVSMRVNTL